MRIAYLCDEDMSGSAGVRHKVERQSKIWRDQGHEVFVYSLRAGAPVRARIFASGLISEVDKLLRHYRNAKQAISAIQSYAPEVIYLRYIKYAPLFAVRLRKICPYVIEVNTNDVREFGLKNRWHGVYNRATRSTLFRNAAGMVCVTEELRDDFNFSRYGLSTAVIPNGITLDEHQGSLGSSRNDRFRLVFVGSANMNWHGTDKIIQMARCLSDFEFHVYGLTLADLSSAETLPKNLIAHGPVSETELTKGLRTFDVAISTLALHRNDMNEACPLKSRQYLANGLPIIVGYKDPDLRGDLEFVLDVGNCERNVLDNIDRISDFVHESRSFDRERIIAYSRAQLSDLKKESLRLVFLHGIYAAAGPIRPQLADRVS